MFVLCSGGYFAGCGSEAVDLHRIGREVKACAERFQLFAGKRDADITSNCVLDMYELGLEDIGMGYYFDAVRFGPRFKQVDQHGLQAAGVIVMAVAERYLIDFGQVNTQPLGILDDALAGTGVEQKGVFVSLDQHAQAPFTADKRRTRCIFHQSCDLYRHIFTSPLIVSNFNAVQKPCQLLEVA